jgi:hypothetical protein
MEGEPKLGNAEKTGNVGKRERAKSEKYEEKY